MSCLCGKYLGKEGGVLTSPPRHLTFRGSTRGGL